MNFLLQATSNQTNSTSDLPAYSGFLLMGASSFFLGSNFIPIKSFESGDGMFFQFIFCVGVWTVGFVMNIVRQFPKYYALAMLGGFMWTTGNINTVAIIKTIGMGMGVLIWGGVSLIFSWATARFGWFGLKPNVPSNVVLNYIAVAIIFVSTIFYLFIKTETHVTKHDSSNQFSSVNDVSNVDSSNSRINLDEEVKYSSFNNQNSDSKMNFLDKLTLKQKHILGIVLASLSGVCYSQCNTPILYVIANYPDASKNLIDYLFSYHTGVLFTSLFYFVVYCIFKKNKPDLYPKIILPGLVAGSMVGMGSLTFFLALNALSPSVSFPLLAAGPSIVSNLWGIFLFKEIRGIKNFILLFIGFGFAITGSILCGLSF